MRILNIGRMFVFILMIFSLLSVSCGSGDSEDVFSNLNSQTVERDTIAEGLEGPTGVAIDPNAEKNLRDHIFVAEFDGGAISIVSPDGSTKRLIEGLNGPTRILPLTSTEKTLLVSESLMNRIMYVYYDTDPAVAKEAVQFSAGLLPGAMVSAGPFNFTIARDNSSFGKDSIFIINTNTPVKAATGFTDLSAITFRMHNGKPQFLVAATKNKEGVILIVDTPENIPDEPKNGGYKVFAKGLSNPRAIAIGPETGFVYVAESGNNRIIRFSADGKMDPNFSEQIADPVDMVFDSAGNLYVSSKHEGKLIRISGINEGYTP